MNTAIQTILLTGGSGFIGSHLRMRLQQLHSVRIVCLSSQGLQATSNEEVVPLRLGELNARVWTRLGISQFDVVYHIGAFTPKCQAAANNYVQITDANIAGTVSLLQSLERPPKRLVFASTLDVYGHSGLPISEETVARPCSLYGWSKLFCEQVLRADARSRGYELNILRYGHVYGPGEAAYKKLIPTLIRNALDGIALNIYCDGTTKRDFIFVRDAVEATFQAGMSASCWPILVNVVRGESITIKEVAELISKIAGPVPVYYQSGGTSPSTVFDNQLLASLLERPLFTSFEAGIAEEVNSFFQDTKIG